MMGGRQWDDDEQNAAYPMYDISWGLWQIFISKLNRLTGRKFRAPTEAEWEYAARGGCKSNGFKYSGSDDIYDVAWFKYNSDYSLHPVATKSPNELGLYDMTGNASEFCLDLYVKDFYTDSPSVNPCNDEEGYQHVIRGGSSWSDRNYSRVSYRGYTTYSGLRLVLSNNYSDKGIIMCPDEHHPHMIDLGLPSGTKWSCCNVGATNPEEKGGYYAWGETEEKSEYKLSNYQYCNGTWMGMYSIGNNISGTNYDVAHVKWGDSWVMPSSGDFSELKDCSKIEVYEKDYNGFIIIGPNGRAIFLKFSDYWTSQMSGVHVGRATYAVLSPYTEKGIGFHGYSSVDRCRYDGMLVRPIVKP